MNKKTLSHTSRLVILLFPNDLNYIVYKHTRRSHIKDLHDYRNKKSRYRSTSTAILEQLGFFDISLAIIALCKWQK